MGRWTFRNAALSTFLERLRSVAMVFALLALGPSAAWAEDDTDERVSRAITDLRDGNPDIRRDAAIDLGNMVNNSSDRQKAEKAVPALLSALKDDDADVRGDAARALGIIAGIRRRPSRLLSKHLRTKIIAFGKARQKRSEGSAHNRKLQFLALSPLSETKIRKSRRVRLMLLANSARNRRLPCRR